MKYIKNKGIPQAQPKEPENNTNSPIGATGEPSTGYGELPETVQSSLTNPSDENKKNQLTISTECKDSINGNTDDKNSILKIPQNQDQTKSIIPQGPNQIKTNPEQLNANTQNDLCKSAIVNATEEEGGKDKTKYVSWIDAKVADAKSKELTYEDHLLEIQKICSMLLKTNREIERWLESRQDLPSMLEELFPAPDEASKNIVALLKDLVAGIDGIKENIENGNDPLNPVKQLEYDKKLAQEYTVQTENRRKSIFKNPLYKEGASGTLLPLPDGLYEIESAVKNGKPFCRTILQCELTRALHVIHYCAIHLISNLPKEPLIKFLNDVLHEQNELENVLKKVTY